MGMGYWVAAWLAIESLFPFGGEKAVAPPDFSPVAGLAMETAYPWAKPLADGPVRILFILPQAARDDVRVCEALLDCEPAEILLSDREHLVSADGDARVALNGVREILKRDYDLYVIANCAIAALPTETLNTIAGRVEKGAGLLTANVDLAEEAPPEYDRFRALLSDFAENTPPDLTRGIGMENTPELRERTGFVRSKEVGKGRVVTLDYLGAPPETHALLPPVSKPSEMAAEQICDYWSLILRDMLWAARRTPSAKIADLVDSTPRPPDENEIPPEITPEVMREMQESVATQPGRMFDIALEAPARRDHAVRIRVRTPGHPGAFVLNPKSRLRKGTDVFSVTLPFPPGVYDIDCWLLNKKGSVADWFTRRVTFAGWPVAKVVQVTKSVVLPNDSVDMMVHVRRLEHTARPCSLYAVADDAAGRVVAAAARVVPPDGGDLPLRLTLSDLQTPILRVAVFALDHPVPAWNHTLLPMLAQDTFHLSVRLPGRKVFQLGITPPDGALFRSEFTPLLFTRANATLGFTDAMPLTPSPASVLGEQGFSVWPQYVKGQDEHLAEHNAFAWTLQAATPEESIQVQRDRIMGERDSVLALDRETQTGLFAMNDNDAELALALSHTLEASTISMAAPPLLLDAWTKKRERPGLAGLCVPIKTEAEAMRQAPWLCLERQLPRLWMQTLPSGAIPAAAQALLEENRRIGRGMQRLFLEAEPVRARFAVYLSEAALEVSRTRPFEIPNPARSAEVFRRILWRMGYASDVLTPGTLAEAMAAGTRYACLVVPGLEPLTNPEFEQIQDFRAAGGGLVADLLPEVRTEASNPQDNTGRLGVVFGVSIHDQVNPQFSTLKQLRALSGRDQKRPVALPDGSLGDAQPVPEGAQVLAACSTADNPGTLPAGLLQKCTPPNGPSLLLNFALTEDSGNTALEDYLARNLITPLLSELRVEPDVEYVSGKPANAYQCTRFTFGTASMTLLLPKRPGSSAEKVRIRANPDRYLYAPMLNRLWKPGRTAKLKLEPSTSLLLTQLPYRVNRLIVKAADHVFSGQRIHIEVWIEAENAVPGKHLAGITLSPVVPTADVRQTLEQSVVFEGGHGQTYIPVQLGQIPGEYVLTATDALTGESAHQKIIVRPGAPW